MYMYGYDRFAELGANVILACRSAERTADALQAIKQAAPAANVEFIRLDLQELSSVRQVCMRIDPTQGLTYAIAHAHHHHVLICCSSYMNNSS